jgi:hypothetical protein
VTGWPGLLFAVAGLLLCGHAPRVQAGRHATSAQAASTASPLDYTVFRERVQPVFLVKSPGFARCYVCHSQSTAFRLQRFAQGQNSWSEEDTRRNFEAIQRLVVPGRPEESRLLLMPLARAAGGTAFHPGGKRWNSQSDPEWKELAQWIRAAAR